jgi:hypothetical protein
MTWSPFFHRTALLIAFAFQLNLLSAQDGDLLLRAYQSKSDSLMQLFFSSVVLPEPVPDTSTPKAAWILKSVLKQAAKDMDLFSSSGKGQWKVAPLRIPVFSVGEWRGHPYQVIDSNSQLMYYPSEGHYDLRFLAPDSVQHFIWLDTKTDSVICAFLDGGVDISQWGLKSEILNERFQFFCRYIPMHIDGAGFNDMQFPERNFIYLERPFLQYPWTYATEPFIEAFYSNFMNKAWVVFNQMEREVVFYYKKKGKHWKRIRKFERDYGYDR